MKKEKNTRNEGKKQRLLNKKKIIQCLIDVTLCLDIGGNPFRGHSKKKMM